MRTKLAAIGLAACIGLICFQSAGVALAHTAAADQMSKPSAQTTEKTMLAQKGSGAGAHATANYVRRQAHQGNKGMKGMNH